MITGGGKTYYGSTCDDLEKRFNQHKRAYKSHMKRNIVCNASSYKVVYEPDSQIELVENWPCDSKQALCERETYYIQNNDCINMIKRAYRSTEETKEYQKQYREDNKEYLDEHKVQYRKDNGERLKAYDKQRYHNNEKRRQALYERNAVLIDCECGKSIRRSNIYNHRKSKTHMMIINTIL